MFSTKEFQDWAKNADVVLFASIMTRIPGRKHDRLLVDYGFSGFPSMAILDGEGEALNKSVPRDFAGMKSATKYTPIYFALKTKVEAGEQYDKGDWLLARMLLNKIELDEAQKELESTELSEKAQAQANGWIYEQEANQILAKMRKSRDHDTASQKALEQYTAGRLPPEGSYLRGYIEQLAFEGADLLDDDETYKKLAPKMIANAEKQLKELQDRIESATKDRDNKDTKDAMRKRIDNFLGRAAQVLESQKKSIEKIRAKLEKIGS